MVELIWNNPEMNFRLNWYAIFSMKKTSCLRKKYVFLFLKLLHFNTSVSKWFSTIYRSSNTKFGLLCIGKLKVSNKSRHFYDSIFLFSFRIKNVYLWLYFPLMKEFALLRIIRSLPLMSERIELLQRVEMRLYLTRNGNFHWVTKMFYQECV